MVIFVVKIKDLTACYFEKCIKVDIIDIHIYYIQYTVYMGTLQNWCKILSHNQKTHLKSITM